MGLTESVGMAADALQSSNSIYPKCRRRTGWTSAVFFTLAVMLTGLIVEVAVSSSGGARAEASEKVKYPGFVNMLLLKKPFVTSVDALKAGIASYVGDGNVSVKAMKGQRSQAFVVRLAGRPYAVMLIDQPIPGNTFKNALKSVSRPKNAENLIAGHNAHAIISPLAPVGNMGQGLTSAIGLMEISAIIAEISGADAHFWSTSEMLMARKPFSGATIQALRAMDKRAKGQSSKKSNLPGWFWVGCQLYAGSKKGTRGCITQGLSSIMGYELDISPITWKPSAILLRVYGTIEYLFLNGSILRDGESVGASQTEKFRLRYMSADGKQPARFVLKLEGAD